LGADLVGKRFSCIDPVLSMIDFEGFYEACKRKINREECVFYANAIGFSKQEKSIARLYFNELLKKYENVWSHTELKNYCLKHSGAKGLAQLCPYEISLKIARKASIIIADYYHLFNPLIKEIILDKINKKLSNSILIIDEAHNLPERIRSLMSNSLTTISLKKAFEECKKLGLIDLEKKLRIVDKALKKTARKHLSLKVSEALVLKNFFLNELEKNLTDFEGFILELREAGLEFLEASSKHSSALLSISRFLSKWVENLEGHVRIIKRFSNGKDFGLQIKSLDASLITRKIFNESHSVVLMSGTLLPTKMYADLLGLNIERTVLKEYDSPFPRENRLNLIVPSVTTKFSNRNFFEFEKIAEIVSKIVNKVPGNSAVFFPSFNVLEKVSLFLEKKVSRTLLKQKEKMSASEVQTLLNNFKNAGNSFGAVLLAVSAGSFAEGIDLPGNQLLCAIIVGIPLQEMTLELKCLIDYFQEKFGRGWHYGYIFPSMNKAIQAAGRVIRSSEDEGIIVFMDKRFTWKNYASCFPKNFSKIVTNEPEKFVELFWSN
jgi:DNA excision repair protein ERCC-2